jgi:hypothetical protein
MHISIVDDKTEEKRNREGEREREREREREEERSITFEKPNAQNSQNLLKIGYQPTQIDKKTPRNCMPTIGNVSHTQQKSSKRNRTKIHRLFCPKILPSGHNKNKNFNRKKMLNNHFIPSTTEIPKRKGITPQNIVPIPSIQFSPSQAKLPAAKKQPKRKTTKRQRKRKRH